MTAMVETCLTRLNAQGRLLSAMVEGPSAVVPGRALFRGELAVKFAATTELEKKPPELLIQQVLLADEAGALTFFAAYLLSFESLAPLASVLGGMLTPKGKYFAFCNNIDLSARYQVPIGDATFYVLPIDESSVISELADLLRLDRDRLKKANAAEKVDSLVSAAAKFNKTYEKISYERGLELMGPVRDPGENRPV
jgi:hypothetical protein